MQIHDMLAIDQQVAIHLYTHRKKILSKIDDVFYLYLFFQLVQADSMM